MNRFLVLAAVLTAAAGVSVASVSASSPRSGALHATKECSEYTGLAGSFCTFTSSNLRALDVGSRIVYLSAAGATSLDTDVVLEAGPGNNAFGHCTLVFAALPGECTFWGGTGQFTWFHADVVVSTLDGINWHWDGSYSFSPRD
jgi:hypothetical protein